MLRHSRLCLLSKPMTKLLRATRTISLTALCKSEVKHKAATESTRSKLLSAKGSFHTVTGLPQSAFLRFTHPPAKMEVAG